MNLSEGVHTSAVYGRGGANWLKSGGVVDEKGEPS